MVTQLLHIAITTFQRKKIKFALVTVFFKCSKNYFT